MGSLNFTNTIAEIPFDPAASGARQEGLRRMWQGYVTDQASGQVIKVAVTVKRALPGLWPPQDGKLYAYGRLDEKDSHGQALPARTWRTPVGEDFESLPTGPTGALRDALQEFKTAQPDSIWGEVLEVVAGTY